MTLQNNHGPVLPEPELLTSAQAQAQLEEIEKDITDAFSHYETTLRANQAKLAELTRQAQRRTQPTEVFLISRINYIQHLMNVLDSQIYQVRSILTGQSLGTTPAINGYRGFQSINSPYGQTPFDRPSTATTLANAQSRSWGGYEERTPSAEQSHAAQEANSTLTRNQQAAAGSTEFPNETRKDSYVPPNPEYDLVGKTFNLEEFIIHSYRLNPNTGAVDCVVDFNEYKNVPICVSTNTSRIILPNSKPSRRYNYREKLTIFLNTLKQTGAKELT